jgi:uncharacterized membrane protein
MDVSKFLSEAVVSSLNAVALAALTLLAAYISLAVLKVKRTTKRILAEQATKEKQDEIAELALKVASAALANAPTTPAKQDDTDDTDDEFKGAI